MTALPAETSGAGATGALTCLEPAAPSADRGSASSAPAQTAPATRRGPSHRTKLGVFAACLVLGPCLAELVVRLFVPVRNVGPSFTLYDPVYGKVLKRSFHCTRTGPEFTMSFTTNSLGFRGPEPAVFPSRGVLFLGDSLTMGHGVTDGREYPALVVKELDARLGPAKLPVVNTGVGATGNGRWIKFLRREAPAFDPRLVVLEVCSNDVGDNWDEGLFRLDERGDLVEEPVVPSASWKRQAQSLVEAIPGLSYSHLVSFLREDHSRVVQAREPDVRAPGSNAPEAEAPTVAEALTLRLVGEALSICREKGWPTLVITANVGEQDDRFATLLANLCREARVERIRIPLQSERPEMYFRVDRHWTEAGHAYVAQAVLAALSEFPDLLR